MARDSSRKGKQRQKPVGRPFEKGDDPRRGKGPPKGEGGRPPDPDRDEKARRVWELMAEGKLVKDACLEVGVAIGTYRGWVLDHADFAASHARARELQAHALVERAVDISRGLGTGAQDRLASMAEAAEGVTDKMQQKLLSALEFNAINRDRLEVDTLKWLAARTAPREYGDKQKLHHGGEIVMRVRREHKKTQGDADDR